MKSYNNYIKESKESNVIDLFLNLTNFKKLDMRFDFFYYYKNFDDNESTSSKENYFFDDGKLILVYNKRTKRIYIKHKLLQEITFKSNNNNNDYDINIIQDYLQKINFCESSIKFDIFYEPYDKGIEKHFDL